MSCLFYGCLATPVPSGLRRSRRSPFPQRDGRVTQTLPSTGADGSGAFLSIKCNGAARLVSRAVEETAMSERGSPCAPGDDTRQTYRHVVARHCAGSILIALRREKGGGRFAEPTLVQRHSSVTTVF